VLLERQEKFALAIDIYLEILAKINIKGITFELSILVDQNQSIVSSNLWDFHSCDDLPDMPIRKKGSTIVTKVHKFSYIKKFDCFLQRACRIADIKVNKSEETSEEAWFKILKFIEEEYIMRRDAKCEYYLKKGYKQCHSDRLKDFAVRRKDSLLKMDELQISLIKLINKLKLEYKQVKKLFQFKILKSRDVLNLEQFDELFMMKHHQKMAHTVSL